MTPLRLSLAGQIAAALAVAPASPTMPAGPERAARHIAHQAVEIADAVLAELGRTAVPAPLPRLTDTELEAMR